MNQGWPHTLLNRAVYPHPVDELQLIETHISWVILTGPFAYKIKKPVALDFLDFSTLERRRYYCQKELELNRRFAGKLYLDVVPVTGSKADPQIGGEGDAIEFAVKMHQFDNSQLAAELAMKGQLTNDLVRQLAKMLAGFHRELPTVEGKVARKAAESFYAAAMQNFDQIRAYLLPADIEQVLAACEEWTTACFQRCLGLMESRQGRGFIKDCHGDCHLGNVAIIDGVATLFDCVEFNENFRIMDTIAEAAFLSMDLCARNLPEHSQRFLNTYLEYRGDYEALPLLNLYRCYYALVRAKVNLMKLPAESQPSIAAETHREFYSYIELADYFTKEHLPVLVLMHGLSGSGKSWVAERLAARTDAIRIRSDVERKRLFSLEPEQSGDSVPALYSKEVSRITFDRLLELSRSIIAAGMTCIVDATFLSGSAREPFIKWATDAKVPAVIVSCHASEKTILRRLKSRAEQANDPSDADSQVYYLQKSNIVEFTDREKQFLLNVNTESENCVEYIIAKLAPETGK